MVMVDASCGTVDGHAERRAALYPSPHQRSRRRPKLIMRPITSAAFSAAFAFASARLRLREQNFAAPRCHSQ